MVDPQVTWSYRQALGAIRERSDLERGYISDPRAGDEVARNGLRRMAGLMERLGQLPASMPVIHVAGSKGKGSTCAFLTAILQAAGLRVGTYTSPHLHMFRERIAIDGQPIEEPAFARTASLVDHAALDLEQHHPELGRITAFEFLTAMGLHHLATSGCEVAVVEVGLGGTLDSTNIVDPAVSLIAALDLEHTAILGHSLAEIAANKAGIIKAGRPAVTVPQPPDALAVIESAAHARGSRLLVGGRDWSIAGQWRDFTYADAVGAIKGLHSGLIGDHQMVNAGLAIAGLRQIDSLAIDEQSIRTGVAAARWPGRYEVVDRPGGGRVILDGAHTPASAAALAATLAAEEPGLRMTIILGVLRDKDPRAIAEPLALLASQWIASAPATPRAVPPVDLAAALKDGATPVATSDSIADGLAHALISLQAGEVIVVTGSLSTVAEARNALGLASPDPLPDHPPR